MHQPLDTARAIGHVRLQFADEATSKIPRSLSAVEQIGRSLWLGGDETASVERVTTDDFANYGHHRSFPLSDCFPLPGGPDQEVDLEGLALDDESGRLWLVGSHSLRRGQPKLGDSDDQAIVALGKVDRQANRYLLGSIKVDELDVGQGQPPKLHQASGRSLPFTAAGDALTDLLAADPQFAPYLAVPSKDNGFDIEGLAVRKGTVLLGLRGPVMRGWATILQLRPQHKGDGVLQLDVVGAAGRRMLRHVLDLGGLGIRDLCITGDDLLILAGPTMALDGPFRIFRWRNALEFDRGQCVDDGSLQLVCDIASGHRVDHAEGLALFRAPGQDPRLLVVYDSPAENRLHDGQYFEADIFAV